MYKPQSTIEIHSKRRYGEPRLPKPKELKGIKQSFSVDWIPKKCRCACYILKNDIYIKHRDFGSIALYGQDHEFRKRFIYNDSFGCVVLRGEAWLVIKNIKQDIESNVFILKIWNSLAEQITGELGNCEWERFLETVVKRYKDVTYCAE